MSIHSMKEIVFSYCVKCAADYLICPDRCSECSSEDFAEGTAREIAKYRMSLLPLPTYRNQTNFHLQPGYLERMGCA